MAEACLDFADETLRGAQRWPWQKRVPGVGERIVQFALPLELCKTSNARMHRTFAARPWLLAKLKSQCTELMTVQALSACPLHDGPLPGRPMVRAIRFSSRETDVTSDWAKVPIDRLRVGKNGLGFIVDDSPRYCEIVAWCEYAPPGKGFVLIEVWAGTEALEAVRS